MDGWIRYEFLVVNPKVSNHKEYQPIVLKLTMKLTTIFVGIWHKSYSVYCGSSTDMQIKMYLNSGSVKNLLRGMGCVEQNVACSYWKSFQMSYYCSFFPAMSDKVFFMLFCT